MRFKLTKELCYLAGIMSNAWTDERSNIGIKTRNDELVERFVKYAIALGVDPKKIIVEEMDEVKQIHFYHSKISRQIREVLSGRTNLPRRNRELAIYLVAGMFDSKGRVTDTGVFIQRLDKSDGLLLELLGVHTQDTKILNISNFLALIKKESVLASVIHLPSKRQPMKRKSF